MVEIKMLLNKIEELQFELGHTKATESTTGHIDKTLVHLAFNLAVLIYEESDLKKYIEGVLYYEKDEMKAAMFKELLANNNKAGAPDSFTTIYYNLSRERKYLKMFEMLDQATKQTLSASNYDFKEIETLLNLSIDLLELLDASKQYEMEFSMHSQLIRNRNALFRTLLRDNPPVLNLFDKIIKGPK